MELKYWSAGKFVIIYLGNHYHHLYIPERPVSGYVEQQCS
jgi:hypothetical protein